VLRRLLFALVIAGTGHATARPEPPPDAPIEAFVAGAPGLDTLTLRNLITGESVQLSTNGARYSIVGREVVFQDEASGIVQAVGSDGNLHEHPLIQPSSGARRIDWSASADGRLVAWTITEGTPNALTTATYIATPEGAGARLVLRDGPRDGIRAFPIGFSPDGGTLYMDYQPDTIADLTPLRQYAAMFALDLASGSVSSLPGEASCYCGGAIGAGRFVRMALAAAGFELRVTELAGGGTRTIPSLGLAEYTQAGDVLIAPDGSRALYTLLQLVPGGAQGEVRALYVLVDLIGGSQRVLNPDEPDARLLRPVSWSGDSAAVLMIDPAAPGTWRLDTATGDRLRVATASFVGSTFSAAAVQ